MYTVVDTGKGWAILNDKGQAQQRYYDYDLLWMAQIFCAQLCARERLPVSSQYWRQGYRG